MRPALRWMYGACLSLALALLVPWALAQGSQGMGQQQMGHHMRQGQGMSQGMSQGMGMSHYDPSTVVTVKGTVQEVQQGTTQGGHHQMGGMGVHLILKSGNETQTVLVGPQSFLAQKNFSFSNGDQIEVTGSKVKYGTSEAIIAREIKKDGKTLTLRNEQGVPEWSGRGRP